MRSGSCEDHVGDYEDDDSTVIYGAVAWAKPLKDFNLSYLSYNPQEDFITSAQQIKHSAQGSKGQKMDNSEIKPTQNSATACKAALKHYLTLLPRTRRGGDTRDLETWVVKRLRRKDIAL